jgi:hypothetical protein
METNLFKYSAKPTPFGLEKSKSLTKRAVANSILSLIVSCLAISCSSVYLPNSHNVPMLSKAGEVQGHLSFVSGYNLQAAVAVTNNVAVMANGMYSDSKQSSDVSGSKYNFGELGAGYFVNTDKYYIDLFGGYGAGKTSTTDSTSYFVIRPTQTSYVHITSVNYNRYFLQFSFGIKRDHFQGAATYRLSLMDFRRAAYNGNSINVKQNPVYFFEPAAVVKFPFGKFMLSAQAGLCLPVNDNELHYDYIPVTISTGLGFRLGYTDKK